MSRQSAEQRALDFAENNLRVNVPYVTCTRLQSELTAALKALADLRSEKRTLEARVDEITMDVTADESGKHSSLSVSAFERHMKLALHKSDAMREARKKVIDTSRSIDSTESVIRQLESAIKIEVARMHELGGYMNYLSAVKVSKTATTTESEN